jgi:pilus assembly protein Flp/PilA
MVNIMRNLSKMLKAFWQEESGLTVVEYAVAGGLIAAAVVVAFRSLGEKVGGVVSGIDGQLTVPAGQ